MVKIDTSFRGIGYIESLIGGRSENQDSFGWSDGPSGLLVVVCDGMGGLTGGKLASKTAVDTLISEFKECHPDDLPAEFLKNAIIKANEAVLEAGRNCCSGGIGTTVTALVLNESCATIAHLGDSRVYQLRGRRKIFRTFDHSMVFELVRSGIITEEQARLSANSNVITRALGISETVDVVIEEVAYNAGDRFVLCTDGFWGSTDESTFIGRLTRKSDLEKLLSFTASLIDEEGIAHGGGHDNLTAAVVDVFINSKKKPEMRKGHKILLASLILALIVSVGLNLRSTRAYAALKELGVVCKELKQAEETLTAKKIEKIITKAGIQVEEEDSIAKDQDNNKENNK